jgi:hypothetical protein
VAGREGGFEVKKSYVIGGAAACVLGALLAWYFYVQPPPETVLTDSELKSARQELEQATARMDEIVDRVRKEVTGIRGKVSREVESLPPDGVARGLNNELASFRRMEIRPKGMDSP